MQVLIADDDATNRLVLSCYLQRFGVQILEAVNGREAIELALEKGPDLILMDIGMPVICGIEATKTLKSLQQTSQIPILVFSGHNAGSLKLKEALNAGCEGVLRKPVDMGEVETLVARYNPSQ